MSKNVIFHLTLISFFCYTHTSDPVVEISDGKILGRQFKTPGGKLFHGFQGIPYASPPLGNLRFSDPQPPSKWEDVKDCRDKNIVCIQIRKYSSNLETEDCLVLNVYTPKLPSNGTESDLPVMVYFYGGGYYIGNSTYDGYGPEFFMEFDVIIVTVNYRVGAFGFLSTQDNVIPGNFGLRDQQLALKWTKNNIAKFGGDPTKVTIFGNSAGAASVGLHILNKENEGLFRAAILASGSPLNSWSLQRHAKKIAYLTAQFLNTSSLPTTSLELLQVLRRVDAVQLKNACLKVLKVDIGEVVQTLNGYFYAPVIDDYRKDGYLKGNTYELVEKGNFRHVPLMTGITSEEAISWVEGRKYFKEYILKKYDSNPELMVNDLFNIVAIQDKKNIGNLIHEMYAENGKLFDKLHKGIRFFSDSAMNNAVLKYASLESRFKDVYLYQFTYDGLMGNSTIHLEGADSVGHTEDMNYIWRRNLPTANNLILEKFPEEDKLVQKRLLTLYTNFAKYLNPTPKKDPLLNNVEWVTVNSADSPQGAYLNIDKNLEIKYNLKHDTYMKWNDIFEKYAVGPHTTF